MKILHLCLANFYIDNYSYQENLLTKFHKKMGMEVDIIASLVTFDNDGELDTHKYGKKSYINENGIPVTRLEYRSGKINKRLRRYEGTFETIKKSKPDIIFIHGCQFLDIKEVKKYLDSNPQVKVYVDNHADFSNSARNWLSKNILHKIIWKYTANIIEPYTRKFYGVLPARVNFLEKIYNLPRKKIELLLMGADDEKVESALSSKSIQKVRSKLKIESDDFLIVTGGKIDSAKRQTLLLMEAIKKMDKRNIKLVVFGSITEDLRQSVEALVDNKNIYYIGWLDTVESYNLFGAADLVVFPGRHSVFWEQVVALGIPLVVKYWEGTTHVDIGGNVIFLEKDSSDEIMNVLEGITSNPEYYKKLLKNAGKEKKNNFLYSNIARQSIEELEK